MKVKEYEPNFKFKKELKRSNTDSIQENKLKAKKKKKKRKRKNKPRSKTVDVKMRDAQILLESEV